MKSISFYSSLQRIFIYLSTFLIRSSTRSLPIDRFHLVLKLISPEGVTSSNRAPKDSDLRYLPGVFRRACARCRSRLALEIGRPPPVPNRLRRRKRWKRSFCSNSLAGRCSRPCSAHVDRPVAWRRKWLDIAVIDRTVERHARGTFRRCGDSGEQLQPSPLLPHPPRTATRSISAPRPSEAPRGTIEARTDPCCRRARRSVNVSAVAVETAPKTGRCGPRTTLQGAVVPLTFLETLLDWKAAVDDVLVAVVGLWALLRSGGMLIELLQRSSALQWAVAAAAECASPPLFSLLSE